MTKINVALLLLLLFMHLPFDQDNNYESMGGAILGVASGAKLASCSFVYCNTIEQEALNHSGVFQQLRDL